ncbi:hypothetical protein BDN72DRAFT_865103 [Pluteus cervinus]|uniref:Uncharacterized protein n=1 Tax=Pluteus cervinus TaxID=181527 RepID=A0ACD3A1C1_9AGAR|nr:hypothetical protein BDN72DRAFT_865103 [Pluteus cervinus]
MSPPRSPIEPNPLQVPPSPFASSEPYEGEYDLPSPPGYWRANQLAMWRQFCATNPDLDYADEEEPSLTSSALMHYGRAPSSPTYNPAAEASPTAAELSDAEPTGTAGAQSDDDDDMPGLQSVSGDEDELDGFAFDDSDSSGAEEPPPSSQSSGYPHSTDTPFSDSELEDQVEAECARTLHHIFFPTPTFLSNPGNICCAPEHAGRPGSELFVTHELVYQYLDGPPPRVSRYAQHPAGFPFVVRSDLRYLYRHPECLTPELATQARELISTTRPGNVTSLQWQGFFRLCSVIAYIGL